MDTSTIILLVYVVLCLGGWFKLRVDNYIRGKFLLIIPVMPIILLVVLPFMLIRDVIKDHDISIIGKVICSAMIIIDCVGHFPVNLIILGICIDKQNAPQLQAVKVVKLPQESSVLSIASGVLIPNMLKIITDQRHRHRIA